MTATSTPTTLAALHVLLVDDDPFMLELLGSMLNKLGVTRVSQAADGERGVAALASGRGMPDVVICDIHMPGKDGFQVMEAMAAGGYKGAVVLLSGMDARTLNSAALMARFHHLNVLGVMTKPVSRAALADLLARVRSL
ncbi:MULTISPECIES: response regulator [Massilia]|uniref:Response regulator n=2 Tax=Massilia TaxID=149698 RepID=A0ABY4A520_9BURK|nr:MULTISPECIES: response regulator [Massilia]NHZ42873.1 response regulator [Massilia aquatica]UOD29836.1 response regulator [Massilia violaceinigra]